MKKFPSQILLIALCIYASAVFAADIKKDNSRSYFFATPITFPEQKKEKLFLPEKQQANFTFHHGINNFRVKNGKITFTMTSNKAILGWGNYLGRQKVEDIQDMGQRKILIQLKLKQSSPESKWTARLWKNGKRQKKTVRSVLKGENPQELSFPYILVGGCNPDGMEFTINAPKGTEFSIDWLKLTQPYYEGYCRSEFNLPEGKIWKAVADVGSMNERYWYGNDPAFSKLFINGKVVERKGALHVYQTSPVDITPYLKPGKNSIGFYGYYIWASPFLYFQAKIIMESGKVITVASSLNWKYGRKYEKGWNLPGFNDSSWGKVLRGRNIFRNARNFANEVLIPGYKGRLDFKNPYQEKLFYADNRDIIVDVHVPKGLKAKSPALVYSFGKSDGEGLCREIKKGVCSSFSENGNSLIYKVNLGKNPHGVYVLAADLKDKNDSLIETRSSEPLVVLRKLHQRVVNCKDYKQGLDLELEDSIDFTNPNDPHPWVEGKAPAGGWRSFKFAPRVKTPRIVNKDGLRYREVSGSVSCSGFSYRFEFKYPGDFYLLELDYPDNQKRTVEVAISSKNEGAYTNSQSGVGAECGGKFFLTGKMQTLRWIHVADKGPHSVDIMNLASGENAAAAKFSIYHIKGDLPSAGSGSNRLYGIHSERCFQGSGVGINFGVSGAVRNYKARKKRDENRTPMQKVLVDLVWFQETAERYVQYLKFCGQNCHVMGCIQYNEYNTPFIPSPMKNNSRIQLCMRTMLASVLDINGIDFFSGYEFSQPRDARTFANDAQVAKGADTIWMVDADGKQIDGNDLCTIVPNWMHPEVRKKYMQFVADMADTFGSLKHYKGVYTMFTPSQRQCYWIPALCWKNDFDNPMYASYDDYTIGLFEKDTGIKLPFAKNDPMRFRKRAAFLKNPAIKKRFLAWRAQKLTDFFKTAVKTLRKDRKDLEFVNTLFIGNNGKLWKYILKNNKSLKEFFRECAMDLDALNNIDGFSTGRYTISWATFASQNPYSWAAKTNPKIYRTFDFEHKRPVIVRTSWHESYLLSGNYRMKKKSDHDRLLESDWIMNSEKTRTLPQPGGYHCREAYIQAIITGDPNLLLGGFTDINLNVGYEQKLRSIMRIFTRLPGEKFSPVLNTGLDTNFAIRKLTKGNESWFYVANPGYWHIKGSVKIKTGGTIYNINSGKKAAGPGNSAVNLNLTPYGLAAFKVDSPNLEITGFTTEKIAPDELKYMTDIVARVKKLMADPAASLALAPRDARFMEKSLNKIEAALAKNDYALAWSLITYYKFWIFRTDFLEKAAANLAQLPNSLKIENPPANPQVIRTLKAGKATGPINIDGKLLEADWQQVPFSGYFRDMNNGRPALNASAVKALYDNKNLYLAFACADNNPDKIRAEGKREKEIFASKDDVLAVMIQPDENIPIYYQMAFNAKNAQFDQRVNGAKKDYTFHPRWKSAVCKGNKVWTAEVLFPFEAFGLKNGKGNGPWRMSFFRVTRNNQLPVSAWTMHGKNNDWHDTRYFGKVAFKN